MNVHMYESLLSFSNELMFHNLQLNHSEYFLEDTLSLLDRFLGFQNTMMASLSNTGIKEIPVNFVTHHVDLSFLQNLLSYLMSHNHFIDSIQDVYILSHDDNYKKSDLYKDVLRYTDYKDIAIQFIKDEKSQQYLSCIIYLNKNVFKKDIIDVLNIVQYLIANAHLENININKLYSHIKKLEKIMNYYSAGILYISSDHHIIHTNAIAKQYLSDLGFDNEKLYNIFFANQVLPYYMKTIRHYQYSLPLRIGNYLFSVVPKAAISDDLCPAYQIFDKVLNELNYEKNLIEDIEHTAACNFMIYSENNENQVSSSCLKEYGLTPKEISVVELVASGKSNKEIASILDISENTVKTHISNVYKKLNINYRIELMNFIHANK